MLTGAVALGITLLTGALQDGDAPPLKWVVKRGDQYELKWTFEFDDRTEVGGRGKVPKIISEKREVKALLTCAEDKDPWRFDILLTDVKWSYATGEYQITAMKRKNRAPDAKVRLLVRDTKDRPGITLEVFEVANKQAEDMKRLLMAPHAIAPLNRGAGVIWTDGRTGPNIYSLFQNAFTHTQWPTEGPLKVGTRWQDSTKGLSPGIPYVDMMEMKLVSVSDRKGAVVKGTGKDSIRKQLLPGRSLKADFSITREFAFAPEGYLASSEEKRTYSRQITATEVQFREKIKYEMSQTLKLSPVEEKPKKGR